MTSIENRYDAHKRSIRREVLAKSPGRRQEEVAHHYASLAATAANMMELIKQRRYAGPSTELDDLISRYEADIAAAHVNDFGADPTWLPHD